MANSEEGIQLMRRAPKLSAEEKIIQRQRTEYKRIYPLVVPPGFDIEYQDRVQVCF